MKLMDRFSVEYREEVFQFLEVAKYQINNYEQINCPCKRMYEFELRLIRGCRVTSINH